MSDSEQSQSLPDSSSDSGSASDSLDRGSVKELTRALWGVEQKLADLKQQLTAYEGTGKFGRGVTDKAIRDSAEEMRKLRVQIEKALKLNREVMRSGHQELVSVAATVREVTGEFKTMAVAALPSRRFMEKLKALHPFFIAAGAIVGAIGLGVGAGSRWHTPLISIGAALGTLGGALARLWQPKDKADESNP